MNCWKLEHLACVYLKEFSYKLSRTRRPSPLAPLAPAAAGVSAERLADEATPCPPPVARWPAGSCRGRGGQQGSRLSDHPSWIYFLQELELAEPQKDFAPSVFSDFHTFLDFKGNAI